MLQVDIGKLMELTEQCHEDSVSQLKSASDQLVQEMLGYIQSTSVSIHLLSIHDCKVQFCLSAFLVLRQANKI